MPDGAAELRGTGETGILNRDLRALRRDPGPVPRAWMAYRQRWKRRRLLIRALMARSQLGAVADRTDAIRPGMILGFATMRNEAARLPHYLDHYRSLGVGHFLIVENASTDGTRALLEAAPDVSLWSTAHSYKASRFGVDWLNGLMMRHGHGHWCLTADADEILIPPHWPGRGLAELTGWLDAQGQQAFGALMIDLYPRGRLGEVTYCPGDDPSAALPWFDADNYRARYQSRLQNWWIQGGVRARCFFAAEPDRAPTMNKIPLVRWNRRYAYVSSTHTMLPRRLNDAFGGGRPSGALLHTKFLPGAAARAREEKARRQHFANSALYDAYYDAVAGDPVLWSAQSQRYEGWHQLEALGLMSRGDWA